MIDADVEMRNISGSLVCTAVLIARQAEKAIFAFQHAVTSLTKVTREL